MIWTKTRSVGIRTVGGYGYPPPPDILTNTLAAVGTDLALTFSQPVVADVNAPILTGNNLYYALTYASGYGTTTLHYTVSQAIPQGAALELYAERVWKNASGVPVPPTVTITEYKTPGAYTVSKTPGSPVWAQVWPGGQAGTAAAGGAGGWFGAGAAGGLFAAASQLVIGVANAGGSGYVGEGSQTASSAALRVNNTGAAGADIAYAGGAAGTKTGGGGGGPAGAGASGNAGGAGGAGYPRGGGGGVYTGAGSMGIQPGGGGSKGGFAGGAGEVRVMSSPRVVTNNSTQLTSPNSLTVAANGLSLIAGFAMPVSAGSGSPTATADGVAITLGSPTVTSPGPTSGQTWTYPVTNGNPSGNPILQSSVVQLSAPAGCWTAGGVASGALVNASVQNNSTQPALYYYASMTATDGTAWTAYTPEKGAVGTVLSGTWSIQSGALTETTDGASIANYMAVFDTGHSDYTATWDYACPNTSYYGGGLAIRASDANNRIQIYSERDAGTEYVIIGKRVAGVLTTLGTWNTPGAAGTTQHMKIVTNGSSISLYVGGVLQGTVTDPFNQTVTQTFVEFSVGTSGGHHYIAGSVDNLKVTA